MKRFFSLQRNQPTTVQANFFTPITSQPAAVLKDGKLTYPNVSAFSPYRELRSPIPNPVFPMSNGLSETPKLSMAVNEKKTRCGLIGQKIGMTTLWDEFGAKQSVSVIKFMDNQVICTRFQNGKWRTQVGAENYRNLRKLNAAMLFFFRRWRVEPKREVCEFEIENDACIPSGVSLNAAHFVAGQFCDVQGVSRGKGFQGAMKRWGFAGGQASHGNSKNHRTLGSTGQSTTPGRVHKGKKMAGNMGNDTCTSQNLRVLKIDPHENLLFVSGPIPGAAGGFVKVVDAKLKLLQGECFPEGSVIPYPTFLEDPSLLPREILPPPPTARQVELDPFLIQRHEATS